MGDRKGPPHPTLGNRTGDRKGPPHPSPPRSPLRYHGWARAQRVRVGAAASYRRGGGGGAVGWGPLWSPVVGKRPVCEPYWPLRSPVVGKRPAFVITQKFIKRKIKRFYEVCEDAPVALAGRAAAGAIGVRQQWERDRRRRCDANRDRHAETGGAPGAVIS